MTDQFTGFFTATFGGLGKSRLEKKRADTRRGMKKRDALGMVVIPLERMPVIVLLHIYDRALGWGTYHSTPYCLTSRLL